MNHRKFRNISRSPERLQESTERRLKIRKKFLKIQNKFRNNQKNVKRKNPENFLKHRKNNEKCLEKSGIISHKKKRAKI